MFTISKRFTFSASHQLDGLPAEHPCSRLHGHNYTVEVVLVASTLDEIGMVHDYRALSGFADWLDERFDHQHLNDQIEFNPTAENLARYIYEAADVPYLAAVRVYETDRTCAEYQP